MKRNFTTDAGYNFIVSYADCTGKGFNCVFVNEMIVHNIENFNKVCLKDHSRSMSNFTRADALGVDCDNEYSSGPQ